MGTMERLRALQRGAPVQPRPELAGIEDVTTRLSQAEHAAISARLRECSTRDDSQAGQAPLRLAVIFDALGTTRVVELIDPVGPDGTNAPPQRRIWIERAVRAVRSPKCNPLPLPPGVLGRPGRINLRVSP
jgi:hypothetical protein